MDHHVGNGEIAQIEKSAEHIAIQALHAAFPVQEVDRPAQLLVRRHDGMALIGAPAAQTEHPFHHPFHRDQHGSEQADGPSDRSGNPKRHPVGSVECRSLRQNFRQHDDEYRHDHGRVDHAHLAEPAEQYAGGE